VTANLQTDPSDLPPLSDFNAADCSKGVQPMPKAVYNSDFFHKHCISIVELHTPVIKRVSIFGLLCCDS